MKYLVMGTTLATALLVGSLVAEEVKSGPQVGDSPIPFNPLHCNGPDSGKKLCLVWKNGNNPVAMIFAREINPTLTSLVKKIDEQTAKNADKKMGSFVVFCNDSPSLEGQLKELAESQKLKDLILSIDNPAGPKGYKIAQEADVTVVLYNKHKVVANHTFKKGDLKAADVEKILKDIPKILE